MRDRPEQPKLRRTILVVDDQESVRTILAHLLRMSGYEAIGAESGPKAIALAATASIDGALIDVHMPVMNGFETSQHLQAQARTMGRELRMWFMTGALTREVECRSAELGAFRVFAKPFECPSFLARLELDFFSPLPPCLALPTPTTGGGAETKTPS